MRLTGLKIVLSDEEIESNSVDVLLGVWEMFSFTYDGQITLTEKLEENTIVICLEGTSDEQLKECDLDTATKILMNIFEFGLDEIYEED